MEQKYINEFIDKLYYGDEMCISYCNNKYFIQGWSKDNEATLEVTDYDHNSMVAIRTCGSSPRKHEDRKWFEDGLDQLVMT